jgi:HAD superfamily hydrolase (TIGR01484 family)
MVHAVLRRERGDETPAAPVGVANSLQQSFLRVRPAAETAGDVRSRLHLELTRRRLSRTRQDARTGDDDHGREVSERIEGGLNVRFEVLASDYDGTLASGGVVDGPTLAALERARSAGWRLVLVTGRQLDDLHRVFPELDRFESVVAENGALLYRPATRAARTLADAPSPRLVRALRARGVEPLSLGRVIVATREPHHATVLAVIRELGLPYQVILNKGAVMVLPLGVDKAAGLRSALDDLGVSPRTAVAVGDAENDQTLLELCGLGVAVANALPALKAIADYVTRADHGAGVVELVDRLLSAAGQEDCRRKLRSRSRSLRPEVRRVPSVRMTT